MMKTVDTLKHELDDTGQLDDIQNVSGIYKVYLPKDFECIIRTETDAITEYYRDGEIIKLLYSQEKLNEKWLQSKNILFNDMVLLYVGKADVTRGRGLHKRVKELIEYGYGLCDNHRGGRALWHIENNRKLLIEVCECENPRETEKEILKTIRTKYSVYPFANWKS